jgi:nuclear pore complex protein Nup155
MHVAVFDWMVSKQLTGDLIAVQLPSLEMYLVRKSEQSPEVCDLLWKYYEKNMNHGAAAKILHELATRAGLVGSVFLLFLSLFVSIFLISLCFLFLFLC